LYGISFNGCDGVVVVVIFIFLVKMTGYLRYMVLVILVIRR